MVARRPARLGPVPIVLLVGFAVAYTPGVQAAPLEPASDHAGWFPFVVPDLAGPETAASPVDLSFLSPEPAGSHGFLRASGEDLVDERGAVVRLFGSNICDYHAMPPKELAPRIAERLRQLGINFIRLHYYEWAPAPDGILNPDYQTLDVDKLDQFDFLISHLKRCGVYVDINLHVARTYPGLPEGWDWMGKALDIVHEPYIESQVQYARDLMGHVNPYTGNAYAHEPAVALVELNNENSPLQHSFWTRFATLPDRFAGPLRVRWNEWLGACYPDLDDLRRAWNGNSPPGPELLRNSDFGQGLDGWDLQNSGGARSKLEVVAGDDGPFLRWDATASGTEAWHLQFFQSSVPVRHGGDYVATFRARADAPLDLQVSLMQQGPPWRLVGPVSTVHLTPQWTDYTMGWTVTNAEGIAVRLNLSTDNRTGRVELGDLSLREGVVNGLDPGQSPSEGTVPLVPDASCPARARDYVRFLMDLEEDYVTRMRRLLKDEIGVGSLVLHTQASYGGLAGLRRAQRLDDVVDCHAYPAHPRRVTDETGRSYWAVNNASMLDGAFGGLESLAQWRVAGKPYIVTEFDLNPPNDHASETFPLLALLGSYQGWAAVADYSWYNFQGTYGHNRINSAFADTGHAGQMACIPAAALLFRAGLVSPAQTRAVLTAPEEGIAETLVGHDWYGAPNVWAQLGYGPLTSWRLGMAARVAGGTGEARADGAPAVQAAGAVSDTGEIAFDRAEAGRETLTVAAPAVRMLLGRVAGRSFALGGVGIAVATGTRRDYANISLVALDGKPVADSRKLLLTAVARVENAGQRWSPDRSHADWGEGPTLAEPVSLTVTLPTADWRVTALDGGGQPTQAIPPTAGSFALGPRYATLWYLFER